MNIEGSVALVTGANRGIGAAFAAMLLERGAAKVYGAARNPATITAPGVTPITLDITSGQDIEAARRACGDVDLLMTTNNGEPALFRNDQRASNRRPSATSR